MSYSNVFPGVESGVGVVDEAIPESPEVNTLYVRVAVQQGQNFNQCLSLGYLVGVKDGESWKKNDWGT